MRNSFLIVVKAFHLHTCSWEDILASWEKFLASWEGNLACWEHILAKWEEKLCKLWQTILQNRNNQKLESVAFVVMNDCNKCQNGWYEQTKHIKSNSVYNRSRDNPLEQLSSLWPQQIICATRKNHQTLPDRKLNLQDSISENIYTP